MGAVQRIITQAKYEEVAAPSCSMSSKGWLKFALGQRVSSSGVTHLIVMEIWMASGQMHGMIMIR